MVSLRASRFVPQKGAPILINVRFYGPQSRLYTVLEKWTFLEKPLLDLLTVTFRASYVNYKCLYQSSRAEYGPEPCKYIVHILIPYNFKSTLILYSHLQLSFEFYTKILGNLVFSAKHVTIIIMIII